MSTVPTNHLRRDVDGLFGHAPEGQVYVCGACGKTSRNRAGFEVDSNLRGGPSVASRGWDESCMLNAVLCFEKEESETMYRPVPSGWLAFNPDSVK